MTISKDDQKNIEIIAKESLDTFTKVAETANAYLSSAPPVSGPGAFASMNTWTSTEAVRNHEQINHANVEGSRILSREPAIARVVVVDENNQRATYYICRAAPGPVTDKGLKLASYRSPVGRLAALPIGSEHTLQWDGQTVSVEVLEYARFQPTWKAQEWDARDSVLEGDTYGPLTIESLRALLKPNIGDSIDATLLDSLLGEESEAANVREGLRRSVITKMDLRDQPVLDQYQDEIFRLPLNSRLLILGAPGTGKTTTLIRRLGQKLDTAFLDADERRAIRAAEIGGEDDHAQSWIMFTPTELLKLYVKEAFNREGIPAPDERISTWTDFRDNLARNEFGILRSAASSSSFVMRDTARTLSAGTEVDQITWFTDFDQWQKAVFWQEMRTAARNLSENPAEDVSKLGRRILAVLASAGATPQPGVFVSLMAVASEVQDLIEKMKKTTDQKIRGALNLQVNRDRRFLDDMAAFIDGLAELNDETDDQDTDDEEEPDQPRVGRAAAFAHYMRAVRAQARAWARKRNIAKASRTGRLIEWLGDRSLAEQDLQDVGESLVVQTALRWLANPVRRYIDGVPARYRRFRRARRSENRWYHAGGFGPTDIHPLEVDILLLAMMRATDDLLTGARALCDTETPASPALERLQRLHRT